MHRPHDKPSHDDLTKAETLGGRHDDVGEEWGEEWGVRPDEGREEVIGGEGLALDVHFKWRKKSLSGQTIGGTRAPRSGLVMVTDGGVKPVGGG